jgi:hypothetical protein
LLWSDHLYFFNQRVCGKVDAIDSFRLITENRYLDRINQLKLALLKFQKPTVPFSAFYLWAAPFRWIERFHEGNPQPVIALDVRSRNSVRMLLGEPATKRTVVFVGLNFFAAST